MGVSIESLILGTDDLEDVVPDQRRAFQVDQKREWAPLNPWKADQVQAEEHAAVISDPVPESPEPDSK